MRFKNRIPRRLANRIGALIYAVAILAAFSLPYSFLFSGKH